MEAIIVAGGRGTRLKSSVWEVPKCLAPIHGRPFLEYLLASLSDRGVSRFIISIGYQKNLVKEKFKNSSYQITWSEEDFPLGTAGAVKKALNHSVNKHVLVVNGDSLFNVDLQDLMKFHRRNLPFVTAAVKIFHEPFRLLNGGLYVVSPAIRKSLKVGTSFEDQFIAYNPSLYPSHEYFIDIGTPESYAQAQIDLKLI